jgi:thioredoxin reductase (NADPH)
MKKVGWLILIALLPFVNARATETPCSTLLQTPLEDVIIIGSGPAGLTAATYASRALLKTLLIEGYPPGGQLMTTSLVENYPAFPNGIMGPQMMMNMREQASKFGTRILTDQVTRVDFSQHPFRVWVNETEYRALSVIVSTGSAAKYLGIPSEQAFLGRGVSGCATCDGPLFKNIPVAVIGGGDSAMEEALFLTRFASRVYIVHRRDSFRASKIMVDRVLKNPKIEVVWNSTVDEILGDQVVRSVRLKNTLDGALSELKVEGVFLAIGHAPNTALFKGQLDLDANGSIVTAAKSTTTNVEGVFAAGDVQDSVYRQAVVAAGSGAMAAIDAERWLESQSKSFAKLHFVERLHRLHYDIEHRDPNDTLVAGQLALSAEALLGDTSLPPEEAEVIWRENAEIANAIFRFVIAQKAPIQPIEEIIANLRQLLFEYESSTADQLDAATLQRFQQVTMQLMHLNPSARVELQKTDVDIAKVIAISSSDGAVPKALDLLARLTELKAELDAVQANDPERWTALQHIGEAIEDLRGDVAGLRSSEKAVFDSEGSLQLQRLGQSLDAWLDPASLEITDANFTTEIVNSKGLFLLDLGAPWCGPCRTMAPHFSKVATERRTPELRFGYANIDVAKTTAEHLGVRSVPTLILFRDGLEIRRQTGATDEDGILQFLQRPE